MSSTMDDLAHLCDLEIACGSQRFGAHRAILAARAPFFRALLGGKFAESAQRTITIEGVSPETFRLVLRYLYTGRIPSSSLTAASATATSGTAPSSAAVAAAAATAATTKAGEHTATLDTSTGGALDPQQLLDLLSAAEMWELERLKMLCERALAPLLASIHNVCDVYLAAQHVRSVV